MPSEYRISKRDSRLLKVLPPILDLRNAELDTEVLMHQSEVIKRAKRTGKPPRANLKISGNQEVETIFLPSDKIGVDYVLLDNLPNLKELHIGGDSLCQNEAYGLRWLICMNLPSLTKITVRGQNLKWMKVENTPSLLEVDVSDCISLEYFYIQGAESIRSVNVSNCFKLRKIFNVDSDTLNILGVTGQIAQIQGTSRMDGRIYSDMTFTDVDAVLEIINKGVKLADQQRLFSDYSYEMDEEGVVRSLCDGREQNPNFNLFSIKLLEPLEYVDSGGTGELYPYALSGLYGVGCASQESCLYEILHQIDMSGLRVPGPTQTDPQILGGEILAFLSQLPNPLSVQGGKSAAI